MKFFKFVFLAIFSLIFVEQTHCMVVDKNSDSRLETFNEYREHDSFDKNDIVSAGDSSLSYRCYNQESEDFDVSKYNKNFYQYALDLIYDLYVSENKMDYGASGKISKEWLEVRGGKFGLTEVSASQDSAQQRLLDAMVAYWDMETLHAARALIIAEVQRKTTEVCRQHIDSKSVQSALQSGYRNELDTNLKSYLNTVDTNDQSLRINDVRINFKNSGDSRVTDTQTKINNIIELEKVLINPKHVEIIYQNAWNKYQKLHRENTLRAETAYEEAVDEYINNTFSINGDLASLARSYFMKLYDKAKKLLECYLKQNFKLEDHNGGDIYNNRDVCTFNALFDLMRQEKGNKHLVAAGGIFNGEELRSYLNYQDRHSFMQFKKFNRDGSIKYQSDGTIDDSGLADQDRLKKELDKLRDELNKAEEECNKSLGNTKAYLRVRANNAKYGHTITFGGETAILSDLDYQGFNVLYNEYRALFAKSNNILAAFNNAVHAYNSAINNRNTLLKSKSLSSEDFVNVTFTNDLSSKTRALAAAIVLACNQNYWLDNSRFITQGKRSSLKVNIDRTIVDFGIVVQSVSQTLSGKVWQYSNNQITPLHLLVRCPFDQYYSNAVKYDQLLAPFGFNDAHFSSCPNNWVSLPSKNFFNETTIIAGEGSSIKQPLSQTDIIDAFGPVIIQVGGNKHAKLGVRDYYN